MYYAAAVLAATLIAPSLLLPSSISTSTSGAVSYKGLDLATCVDYGITQSTCTATASAHIPFTPGGAATTSIFGDWNTASSSYFAPVDPFPDIHSTTKAVWTVNDTITITGGAGAAILVFRFAADLEDRNRYFPQYEVPQYTVFVNQFSSVMAGTTRSGV